MKADKGKTLVISGVGIGDTTFECERGSWNVTRAERDCKAGKHGLYVHAVASVHWRNSNVEVDEAKVAAFMSLDPSSFPPIIFVIEDGAMWLIDGHHRIRALHRRGVAECQGYVIEEADAVQYRVHYNGERVAPWRAV